MIPLRAWIFPPTVLCLALLSGAACGKPSPEDIEERAGPQSICVELAAAHDLNMYQGVAASLVLCVYQLENKKGILAVRDAADGMETLLKGEKFDPSVAGCKRIFLNPGERKTLLLDRRGSVRHIALAAGYCQSPAEDSLLIVDVPPVRLPRFWRKQPVPVVRARLGSDRITRSR